MLRQERGPRHREQQFPGLHALPGHHAVAGHRALPAHCHLSRENGRSELARARFPAAPASPSPPSPWDSAPVPPAGTSSGSWPPGPGRRRCPQAPPPKTGKRSGAAPPGRARWGRRRRRRARGGRSGVGEGTRGAANDPRQGAERRAAGEWRGAEERGAPAPPAVTYPPALRLSRHGPRAGSLARR